MSLPSLPQLQPQPILGYPAAGAGQLLPSPSSYSNDSSGGGSYTKVYIILAAIVLCFLASCFGRFYGHRFERPGSLAAKKAAVLPREKDSDIEFGFDHRKIKTANKPVRYGDLGGHKPVPNGSALNQGSRRQFDQRGPAVTFSVV